MTPLAHRILKDSTLPATARLFHDRTSLAEALLDAHCFEVSAVFDVATELGGELHDSFIDPETGKYREQLNLKISDLAFLPAPKTWLEWTVEAGSAARVGCLLTDMRGPGGTIDANSLATTEWAFSEPFMSSAGIDQEALEPNDPQSGVIELRGTLADGAGTKALALRNRPRDESISFVFKIWALLALINSPRIIGRRSNPPHVGLQRALAQARGKAGRLPLHDWAEIKLEVTPPAQADASGATRLTGSKALHFCRSHLRVRLGRLEYVRSHWRGDPAVGIKRGRYVVVP